MALLPARFRRNRPSERPDGIRGDYGKRWVPQDESEAMDQILNNRNADEFEAAGMADAALVQPLLEPTDTVLDLGCGIGRVTRYVAPMCREIWAVDASETMLGYARERLAQLPNVHFALSAGLRFPEVESGSVDLAYSLLTLQHVEREHAFRLLQELHRVLRTGGTALLTYPNLLSEQYLNAFLHYVEVDEVDNPARARFYTPEEVERLLPAAGFSIRELVPETEIVVSCETV
jgi:ubiquinone/menaquinone biosynthesis C-methylase UbiE